METLDMSLETNTGKEKTLKSKKNLLLYTVGVITMACLLTIPTASAVVYLRTYETVSNDSTSSMSSTITPVPPVLDVDDDIANTTASLQSSDDYDGFSSRDADSLTAFSDMQSTEPATNSPDDDYYGDDDSTTTTTTTTTTTPPDDDGYVGDDIITTTATTNTVQSNNYDDDYRSEEGNFLVTKASMDATTAIAVSATSTTRTINATANAAGVAVMNATLTDSTGFSFSSTTDAMDATTTTIGYEDSFVGNNDTLITEEYYDYDYYDDDDGDDNFGMLLP